MSFLDNFKIFSTQKKVGESGNQTIAQSEFIAFTTHQLKTPLAGIKWSLKMLMDGDVGAITEEQHSLISKIYHSNELVIRMIDQMMSADRMRSGFNLSFSDANIVNLVEEEVQEVLPIAHKKNIHIEINAQKNFIPKVYIDFERMGSVVQNLLENAIRYTNENGLIIVEIKVEKINILVSVKDNGIGIPKEAQKNIFRKFFRAPNAIKSENNGSGLGLFIAQNIVIGHGGEMWFESEEGKGSTFFFTVPIGSKRLCNPPHLPKYSYF